MSATAAGAAPSPPWASERATWLPPESPAVGGVVAGVRQPWEPAPRRPYPAGRWRLFFATNLDGAIISIVSMLLARSTVPAHMENLWWFVWFLNKCVLQGLTGSNAGKWICGVKLVRVSDGEPPGVLRALGRELAHVMDILTLGLGFLWPLWDERRQTFADKIAGTAPVGR